MFPVAALDARAWLEGRLTDLDLLLCAPLAPEVVFACELPPGRAALREALARIGYWKRQGCRAMIARAQGEIIWHYFRWGALPITKETWPDQVKYRFYVPPELFERFTHFTRRTPRGDPRPGRAAAPPAKEPVSPTVRTPGA